MRVSRWFSALLVIIAASVAAQTPRRNAPAKPHSSTPASKAPTQAEIRKSLEAYLRNIYAWGPSFRVQIGSLADAPVPGFYQVSVEVILGTQSDSAVVYVSKDGRFLLRGDMQDMTVDPLAAIRAQIRLANNPSRGPANAKVTVVEYSDFQCPSCKQLHHTLRAVAPKYPQVRFVYKDFPLSQIHPWAMTAALAARCAYQQNPDAFWRLHDSVFESQEAITPENAWQKMLDFATQVPLHGEAFRACMASPEAAQAVQENIKEGQVLKVANTPTVFVNGRRMLGTDQGLLEQYIQYELATQGSPSSEPRP